MRHVRWRYAPLRLLRLLTLTNCSLAQGVLLSFAAIAQALYCHPRGGFLPFVGGFFPWRSLSCGSLSCGSLVDIAFVAPPAAYTRGDPPLCVSSSHFPDDSCSKSPSLLVVIPHDHRLHSSSSRILVLVYPPRRESLCSSSLLS